MPDLKVIDQVGNKEQVFFGAYIELEKDDGDLVNYRIVGPDETDTAKGFISIDSPLAKALLKKQIDDEVTINIAGEKTKLTFVKLLLMIGKNSAHRDIKAFKC